MITVGTMRLPQPEPLDDLPAFLRGLEPDGGYWLTMRRLADHDHSGGLLGVPVAGGGGGTAEVTITGTEGVTVVESPANTYALGLTASPDASNTIEIRTNGIYSAAGAIPPEYVTDAELATALGPYATDADLTAHAGAADPHPTYSTAAELTSAITAHEALANPHAVYALDTDLSTHAGAADPHPGYTTTAELTTALGPYLTSATATTTYVPLAGGSVLTGLLGPTTTNTRDLGTTALRWRKLWAVDGEFTNVPTVGGVSLDSRYALASALTALTTRVTALETSVAALKTHVHELGTFGAGTLAPTGGIP